MEKVSRTGTSTCLGWRDGENDDIAVLVGPVHYRGISNMRTPNVKSLTFHKWSLRTL